MNRTVERISFLTSLATWPFSAAGAVCGWLFDEALAAVEDFGLDLLDVWNERTKPTG